VGGGMRQFGLTFKIAFKGRVGAVVMTFLSKKKTGVENIS
jgi:hypothetical protein